jgi:uncharacterized protein (TIRG00374 family)
LNLRTLKGVIVVFILLVIGIFLLNTYWADILPVLQEILITIRETRLRYFLLAVSVYVLSVYFFAIRWHQVLSCIGYHIKAVSLFPIYFGAIFVTNVTPGGNTTGGESLRVLWANKGFNVSYPMLLKQSSLKGWLKRFLLRFY